MNFAANIRINSLKKNRLHIWNTVLVWFVLLLTSFPSFGQEYKDDTKKIKELISKIEYYTGRDNHKAINLTNKLIVYGEEKTDARLIGIGNIRRAIIYDISGDAKYSFLYFQKGIEQLKETEDLAELAYAYNNFGIHYYYQKDYSEALNYYNKSMAVDSVLKDEGSLIATQINRAVIYKNLNKYDKALGIYKQCLDYYTVVLFDSTMQLTLNQNIASLFYSKDNIDSAFHYASIAYSFIVDDIDTYGITGINTLMANCYDKKGEYQKALQHAKKSLNISEAHKFPEGIMNASEALSNIYSNIGEYKLALQYHQTFFNLNDSLFYRNKSDEISEIQARYQQKLEQDQGILKSQLRIEKLEAEYLILHQENMSRKQREFYVILVLILVGVLIIVMLLFSWNKMKTNKQLRTKNDIIETALNDKDMLIKEVHHRVKNNLQLIVSMMELDSMNIQNPEARQKIRDTILRIQSIGIIHQRLHEQENVTEIDSNIYFKKLIDEILISSKENVKFNVAIDHFFLNIDEGISFGLILNEMITNSIKYVDEKEIQINIEFSQKNDNLIMSYSDNGTVKQEDNQVKGTGFGMKLIKIMSRKLKGKLATTKEQGIEYELVIENYFK